MTDKTQNENAQRIVKTKLNFEKIKSYFQSKASMRFYVSAAQCFLILFAFSQINFAQDDETEAPPPLKIISKEEKTQLDLEVKSSNARCRSN